MSHICEPPVVIRMIFRGRGNTEKKQHGQIFRFAAGADRLMGHEIIGIAVDRPCIREVQGPQGYTRKKKRGKKTASTRQGRVFRAGTFLA